MKKILYLTIADSVHDQRFMQTLAESGYDAYALRVRSGDWPNPASVQTISPMGFDFPLEKDSETKRDPGNYPTRPGANGPAS
jgi:hypothetical protein